jgi:serine/threonine protein kinase
VELVVVRFCENCGFQLSLTGDKCQQCGQPIHSTVRPIATGTFNAADDSGVTPTGTGPMSDDDSARVEQLLGHIAGQSHFEERYILLEELARGGMGQIHRAYDQILRREVAIKLMHERDGGSSDSAAIRGQFLKEARVGGRLLHPNILAVFDLGVNRAGRMYYTMRLVDGASLQNCLDAVDKGVVTKLVSYPLRRIVEQFVGACQGVDYAHQQGVLHLDLKPLNILVSGFNEVFVID